MESGRGKGWHAQHPARTIATGMAAKSSVRPASRSACTRRGSSLCGHAECGFDGSTNLSAASRFSSMVRPWQHRRVLERHTDVPAALGRRLRGAAQAGHCRSDWLDFQRCWPSRRMVDFCAQPDGPTERQKVAAAPSAMSWAVQRGSRA